MTREAVRASHLENEPVEWLWRDRIPKGKITIIAGKPDQGKGLFVAHVAAEVSRRGMNVLYNAMEDDPASMTRPRLEAAGADLDRVLIWRFLLPSQQDALEERIKKHDIKLVVIDPIAAAISSGVSRSSDSIRRLSNPLSEFAEATGVAVLIVDHALKRSIKAAHPLAAISGGSSGLPSVSRMAYLFGCDPKDRDRRILAGVKSNLRDMPMALSFETDTAELADVGHIPYLLVQGEEAFDAGDLLHGDPDSRRPGRPPEKRAAAGEWLCKTLFAVGAPVEASKVYEDAKQIGMTAKTVRNAADDIGVIKNPPGGGRKCKWSLPAPVITALEQAAKAGKGKGK